MSSKRIWGSLDPFLEPGPVLGRRVANSQFLAALLRADPFDQYHFFLADQGGRKDLAERLDGILPPDLRARVRVMDRRELPRALGRNSYHCFHQSDCIALQAHLSRLRNAYSRDVFPVTGPTHSLSYSNYAQAFLNHLWPGASKRDCVVATSRPGLRAVEALFRHLRQALDLPEERFPGPSLKVVPLGVDPDEFKTAPSPAGEGPVRLLVFGRISHYSKMDVLPLFRALQRLFADGLARDRVSLTLAGWVEEGDDFPETLKGLAANIGLDLRVVPRPSAEHKPGLYAAADIFVSIADNPPETFGLTVLEARACRL
ncbi:MAG: glycosyltransferase, partial [Desulfovibrionaceae bacterium]|nr:glycosyltransferase [Desulfovibrionaceae bacterium]